MNGTTDYNQGKQDGAVIQQLQDINSHLKGMRSDLKSQEKRIRKLEYWKWWWFGGSVTVGIGAAKVASAFV